MSIRLLATKFHIPPWRDTGISRPRLLERLTTGLHENRKLTLVSAPVGYGKTTLISEWFHSLTDSTRFVWLSLDENDNDPQRFLYYWLAAFQQADELIREKIQPVLDRPKLPPVNVVMDELLNELAAFQMPVVLTLDDYHLIHNSQIHEALAYFLEHLPVQVHLVITTRQDPPLPLARMRARAQMTEIRAHDLRFSPTEARQFFTDAMKLDLSDEAANTLEERTEGWVVGLQLAGLALRNLADPHDFIENFRGSHRFVLDFLAEEVIRQQEEGIRAFLTQTSILDRFNAGLCGTLTGRVDAQTVITHLEQANLFVVPLDDERIWYRYHGLFSDYLRTLLAPSEQMALYKKASEWHEANDLMFEAVQYALASKDYEFATDVIGRALSNDAIWSGGNVALLSSWLDALPSQALRSRPQLSLNASRVLYLSGRFEQAEKRIAQAEQSLRSTPATTETETMLALAALYRGSIASVRGDVQQAFEQTRYAQARIPRENHLPHARAFFSLGLACEVSDQTECAVQNYLQSSDEALAAGVLFLAVHARCAAAQVMIKQGHLNLAEQTCQAAIQCTEGERIPPLGLALIILGGIALERNELDSAGLLLQDGIALARQGGLMDDVVLGISMLTRLHAVQGDSASAFALSYEASTVLRAYGIPRMALMASTYLTRLQLYAGQKQEAARWADEYQAVRGATQNEYADLTLARVLLATGMLDPLPGILQPLLEKANEAGRMQTAIEAMMLLGLFHQAKKDIPSALKWLEKSLRLAAPEGYIRIFLDEGEPLLDLLPEARSAAPELVDTLLDSKLPANLLLEQLPDPLSEQELRVLDLIVAGKSNREIAEELVISVGTAKWHVHNVLQKLGVNNRPQAIARARELGF